MAGLIIVASIDWIPNAVLVEHFHPAPQQFHPLCPPLSSCNLGAGNRKVSAPSAAGTISWEEGAADKCGAAHAVESPPSSGTCICNGMGWKADGPLFCWDGDGQAGCKWDNVNQNWNWKLGSCPKCTCKSAPPPAECTNVDGFDYPCATCDSIESCASKSSRCAASLREACTWLDPPPYCKNNSLEVLGLCIDCSHRNLSTLPCFPGSAFNAAVGTVVQLLDGNPDLESIPKGRGQLSNNRIIDISNTGIKTLSYSHVSQFGIFIASFNASGLSLNRGGGLVTNAFNGIILGNITMRGTNFGPVLAMKAFGSIGFLSNLDLRDATFGTVYRDAFAKTIVNGTLDLSGGTLAAGGGFEEAAFASLTTKMLLMERMSTVTTAGVQRLLDLSQRPFAAMTLIGNMSFEGSQLGRLVPMTFGGMVLPATGTSAISLRGCGITELVYDPCIGPNTSLNSMCGGPFTRIAGTGSIGTIDLSSNKLTAIHSKVLSLPAIFTNLSGNKGLSRYAPGWASELLESHGTVDTTGNPSVCVAEYGAAAAVSTFKYQAPSAAQSALVGEAPREGRVQCVCTSGHGIMGSGIGYCYNDSCRKPPFVPAHGGVLAATQNELILSGVTVQYTCDSGYVLSGDSNATCVGGFFLPSLHPPICSPAPPDLWPVFALLCALGFVVVMNAYATPLPLPSARVLGVMR